jgi:flagellar M-ring protein FliF
VNFIQKFQEQLKYIWNNFSKVQKVVVGGVSLLVFGVLLFSAFFLGRTDYEPLYPDLNLNDSALITAKLKEMKIDYKLDKNGTTILVPTNLKHQLRLDLANELPQGGVIGFESFNQTRFGETNTDKRVRYLAALQGELTRTIQQMAEVETAKVHIVLPEESLFIRESKPATASVLLKLKPYASMDTSKVRSIVHFLAHSVEGLLPENVTVIDVYGNLLSEGVAQGAEEELLTGKLTLNQITIKKQYEDNLGKSLQTMLEKVLGPGKAVVRASVDLDFDQVEISSEEFGNQVLRSEQLREQISEGTMVESGVPGIESNLTDLPSYSSGGTGETSSEISEIVRNYEIDRIIETRKKAPGEIKSLSVAVIIDGQLSSGEKEDIEGIIARAAGINSARGDQVEITSLPFNTESYSKLQEQIDQETARQNKLELIKYVLNGVGILLGFAFLFFLVRRILALSVQTRTKSAQIPIKDDGIIKELSPEEQEKAAIKKNIDRIAQTQPENIAKVIRTWMAEDSR